MTEPTLQEFYRGWRLVGDVRTADVHPVQETSAGAAGWWRFNFRERTRGAQSRSHEHVGHCWVLGWDHDARVGLLGQWVEHGFRPARRHEFGGCRLEVRQPWVIVAPTRVRVAPGLLGALW